MLVLHEKFAILKMVATRDLDSEINLNKKEFCFDNFLDFLNLTNTILFLESLYSSKND